MQQNALLFEYFQEQLLSEDRREALGMALVTDEP